ncbi:MAG: phosphoribosylanthranilate isomerase [Defluviitaleaceae bacterium]|nr:phosphoribosylanthranilate isomerase [Defluviitaleaceae bacterium]
MTQHLPLTTCDGIHTNVSKPDAISCAIKICGLSRLCDINAVNDAKPDYVGFVFAESRRKVTPQQAQELRSALRKDITAVGVFVNETIENILQLLRDDIIEAIQLHGAEDEQFIKTLKAAIIATGKPAPIIKAVSVQKEGDAQKWQSSTADYLLLDHKSGGTGESFDWNLIGTVTKPFFLAGGLTPQNVTTAIKTITPYAVDTSSGVEISSGIKCPSKITHFIAEAKKAFPQK